MNYETFDEDGLRLLPHVCDLAEKKCPFCGQIFIVGLLQPWAWVLAAVCKDCRNR
jgi:hypothetical protein